MHTRTVTALGGVLLTALALALVLGLAGSATAATKTNNTGGVPRNISGEGLLAMWQYRTDDGIRGQNATLISGNLTGRPDGFEIHSNNENNNFIGDCSNDQDAPYTGTNCRFLDGTFDGDFDCCFNQSGQQVNEDIVDSADGDGASWTHILAIEPKFDSYDNAGDSGLFRFESVDFIINVDQNDINCIFRNDQGGNTNTQIAFDPTTIQAVGVSYDDPANQVSCVVWQTPMQDDTPFEFADMNVAEERDETGISMCSQGCRMHHAQIYDTALTVGEMDDRIKLPFLGGVVADFTASCTETTCTFNGSDSFTEDDNITDFSWDFGDGNTGSGEEVTHTYSSIGTFSVTLTVTNTTGDTDSTTQTVDTSFDLNADETTTTGLEDARRVRTTWDFNPSVWVRDPRDNRSEGKALKFSESLASTLTVDLCQGGQLLNTVTDDGMAVTKEPGGRVVWECIDEVPGASNDERWLQAADADGEVIASDKLFDGPGFAIDLAARTLRNVTQGGAIDHVTQVDMVALEKKLNRFQINNLAIDIDTRTPGDEQVVFCVVAGTEGDNAGTHCWDAKTGGLTGTDESLFGTDVEVQNGTVYVLQGNENPPEIVRLTPELVELNRTDAQDAFAPLRVSKTGDWVAHGNDTEGDRGDVTIRRHHNLSVRDNTVSGYDITQIESIAWHPQDEGIYVLNNTRLDFLNSTILTTSTTTEESEPAEEDPTLADEEDDPEEGGVSGPGNPQDTSFSDLDESGGGIGLTGTGFALFLSVLLILGFAGGGVTLTRGAGETTSLVVGVVGAWAGTLTAWAFGWFPFWGMFAILLISGSILIRQLGFGDSGGGGGV